MTILATGTCYVTDVAISNGAGTYGSYTITTTTTTFSKSKGLSITITDNIYPTISSIIHVNGNIITYDSITIPSVSITSQTNASSYYNNMALSIKWSGNSYGSCDCPWSVRNDYYSVDDWYTTTDTLTDIELTLKSDYSFTITGVAYGYA